jgi:hypothetical protein
VGLFGRRRPLHERLAEQAGLSLDADAAPGLAADAPGWDGEQRGEPGIHGVPRARRWDTVATTAAPRLRGDTVHFVTLQDRTVIVDEDEPEGALEPLADAVETSLEPPYRAEAVRRDGDTWAVAASTIEVAELPDLTGDEAELVVGREGAVLRLDGHVTLRRSPSLERLGAAESAERVVRATRLDGDLWEVTVSPL